MLPLSPARRRLRANSSRTSQVATGKATARLSSTGVVRSSAGPTAATACTGELAITVTGSTHVISWPVGDLPTTRRLWAPGAAFGRTTEVSKSPSALVITEATTWRFAASNSILTRLWGRKPVPLTWTRWPGRAWLVAVETTGEATNAGGCGRVVGAGGVVVTMVGVDLGTRLVGAVVVEVVPDVDGLGGASVVRVLNEVGVLRGTVVEATELWVPVLVPVLVRRAGAVVVLLAATSMVVTELAEPLEVLTPVVGALVDGPAVVVGAIEVVVPDPPVRGGLVSSDVLRVVGAAADGAAADGAVLVGLAFTAVPVVVDEVVWLGTGVGTGGAVVGTTGADVGGAVVGSLVDGVETVPGAVVVVVVGAGTVDCGGVLVAEVRPGVVVVEELADGRVVVAPAGTVVATVVEVVEVEVVEVLDDVVSGAVVVVVVVLVVVLDKVGVVVVAAAGSVGAVVLAAAVDVAPGTSTKDKMTDSTPPRAAAAG